MDATIAQHSLRGFFNSDVWTPLSRQGVQDQGVCRDLLPLKIPQKALSLALSVSLGVRCLTAA